jgi:D-alanyl-lipoteichoic acid acyltransferase DltB (MBOAT superfamily)
VVDYVTPVFNAAEAGNMLTFFKAWGGALAYTVQLYFDFSGYSDMAIGLAYMFGIKLSINFNSPYKSSSIIDFWRRWHITLSRFLRDYHYFSLGGNKKGNIRRYTNLFITMLLGGIWHGASWTFIIWGALHGFYLIVNHAWRKIRKDFLK